MRNKQLRSAFGITALATGLVALSVSAQTTIPNTYVFPSNSGDTTKPGFIWRFSQVAAAEPNLLSWAEDQLAGLYGPNLADSNQVGVALGPAAPPNPNTAPMVFEIPTVINLSKTAGTGNGNFVPDEQMPGLPGFGPNQSDNAASESLTYLDLPAGTITMGVNSDDGFRVQIGGAHPQDKFGVNVGEFNAGRGAADTIFTFTVTTPGIYAARLLWENGGGDANVEWFTVLPDTTKVLVNDTANGGIKAYRAVTGTTHAFVSSVEPVPGATAVSPTAPIVIQITDGSTPIDPAKVTLSLDGNTVNATVTKANNVITAGYTNSNLFLSGSTHTAAISFTEGTVPVTRSWTFTVASYVALDPAWRVTPDTTKVGFNWNIFANADGNNKGNTTSRAEADLALQAVDATGTLLPNNADPNAVGVAIGPADPPVPDNAPIHFEITNVINLSKIDQDTKGNFTPDGLEPGVPDITGATDGQAAEILTYLTLPVGLVAMGVNSDDGFSTASGPNPRDAFGRFEVGAFEGGRGASDTIFYILVQQAGTYPFRTVWENGGGDSNIEWFTIKKDGTKVLVNDVAKGGIPAYRAATGTVAPFVKATSPQAVPRQLESTSRSVTVLLSDGTNPIDDNSVTVTVDGKAATVTKTRTGTLLSVDTGVIDGFHAAGEAHAGLLTYKDSTGNYSRTQQWTFYNLENLILPATPVTGENFDSYPEATSFATTVPPGWSVTNYTWLEKGASGFGPNGGAVWDLTAQANDPFVNWVMCNTNTAAALEKEILDNNKAQTINGVPVTDNWMSGNCLFAASDSRARHCSIGTSDLPNDYAPQIQIVVSPAFDMSTVANPVLTFSSGVRISGNHEQDALEYSVDNGTTWLPGIIMQNAATIFLNSDGSYDAVKMLENVWADVAKFPVVQDPTTRDFISAGPLGGKFGDVLKVPISAALAPYVANRNDTSLARKVEAIRLPEASRKSVRLRFSHYGSCGWEWAIDNIAFYDIAPLTPPAAPQITAVTKANGQITITWINGGTLESSPALANPTWTSTGNSSGTFTEAIAATGNKFYRVKR